MIKLFSLNRFVVLSRRTEQLLNLQLNVHELTDMFACSIKHLKVFKAEALLPMQSHKRPHELSDILLKNWLSYSTQLLLY